MGRSVTKSKIIKYLKSLITKKNKKQPIVKPKVIVSSAVKLKDGRIICCPKHFDKIMHSQLKASGLTKTDIKTQGFVDQFGTFYNRAEAKKIAVENKQIKYRCGGDERQLYSENLY